MEQYIDEFGNLQFRAVGTNNEFPFVNISQFNEGVNKGKSIEQLLKENMIKNFNLSNNLTPLNTVNTQSGFATNFPYQTNVQPAKTVADADANVVAVKRPEEPFEIIGGQKVYIGDTLGRAQALEKANFFEQPTGIMTQAKDFLTQTVPNVIRGGINMIPGMRFIQGLDKFNTLPYQDKKFIQSAMDMKGIPGSGIYVDPRSGLLKDMRGKNVRSLFGNYADSIEKDYNAKVESLEKSKDRWNSKYGDLNNINELGKTWEEMNKRNINEFNFLSNMKSAKDKQNRDLLDKVKEQVEAGVTANIGQSLHGGGDGPKGGDGGFGGFKDVAAYDASQQATYDRAVDRHRG